MELKVLIIPDIHGELFWTYAKDHLKEYDKVIFLGDYLDAWDDLGISDIEMLENLNDIIRFKRENYNKVELLYGNHEFSYIDESFKCSGYRPLMANDARRILRENKDIFNISYQYNNYLFSHAGVVKSWIRDYSHVLEEYREKDDVYPSDPLNKIVDTRHFRCYNVISRKRGGISKYGSPIWADMQELATGCGINNFTQIVGHTPYKHNRILFKKFDKSSVLFCDIGKPIELIIYSESLFTYKTLYDK